MTPKFIAVMQQIADHTAPECASNCNLPRSCCDEMYCTLTLEFAAQHGTVLERTAHPTLPLMGPAGCTAAPHLRPWCTFHTCAINNLGFKPGDPAWTRRYFKLRAVAEREFPRDPSR